jgi:hypothetical protein
VAGADRREAPGPWPAQLGPIPARRDSPRCGSASSHADLGTRTYGGVEREVSHTLQLLRVLPTPLDRTFLIAVKGFASEPVVRFAPAQIA